MSKTRGPVRTPLRGSTAVAVAAVVLLSGCAGLRPGTAVQVGDERISTSEVDDVATQFCSALEGQLEQQAETIPHSYFRGGIAGTLALREIASQVAADFGVEADSEEYLQQQADLRRNVASLSEEQQEAVLAIESAPLYVQEIQAQVGEELLDGEGEPSDFTAAGSEEFQRWIAANGVEFDPALNTELRDGSIATADEALSFAVSEGARAGQEEQPNAVLARQLPDSHRCG